jgi:hypothetical protein
LGSAAAATSGVPPKGQGRFHHRANITSFV